MLNLTAAGIDGSEYRAVVSFAQHTAWLQPAMKVYTSAGLVALCVMAVLAWWRARRSADMAAMAVIAWIAAGTGVSVAVGLGLKQVFAEARPCLAIHTATVEACPGPGDYSFPSDHTIVAAALAAGIWLADRRLGILAAVLALLEAFSRVYLGQHYPHDVVAGVVLGALIILAGWPLARHPLAALTRTLSRSPLRLLITRDN
ncbi:phosphatase PAP2 family protein [Actinomadura barringtoniae]|uniref:Phosphatase PAP2 family protein n=1 Tax=Actinomadura barringtoniae TaxID=1427535 RepID=A0A939TEC9_9ACTN|nr:phosphatase PAP2 family protein [Actinomadura barringtoniae]MBO2453220.1 phosphatase PAP2 family protein [Actinomadura barringtoniae]